MTHRCGYVVHEVGSRLCGSRPTLLIARLGPVSETCDQAELATYVSVYSRW